MDIIYEPKGPAKEYAPLAITCYMGCEHCCKYCYAPEQINKTREEYFSGPYPRENIVGRIKKDASKLSLARADLFREVPDKEILISFIGDPYQPAEKDMHITRDVIEILTQHNLPFTILTKGGTRAVRDFYLLGECSKVRFGTTLVFIEQREADCWEPKAPTIQNRIEAIQKANEINIPTWVSLEPVIDPEQTKKIIVELQSIVTHWEIGKINHNREIEKRVNWITFREEIKELCESLSVDYHLKEGLTKL